MDSMIEAQYIYLLTTKKLGEEKLIKVGSTGDLNNRIGPYETSLPGTAEYRPFYVAMFRVGDPSTQAHAVHIERLVRAKHHINATCNEWYHYVSIEDVKATIISLGCVEITNIPQSTRVQPIRFAEMTFNAEHVMANMSADSHFKKLRIAQEPFTQEMALFLQSSEIVITFTAACSFGKTNIVITALERVKIPPNVVLIVAPTISLCEQWVARFPGAHTCCNMGCDDFDISPIKVIVFDEAHHMAGPFIDKDDDRGAGQTRKLLKRLLDAPELQIKRIFTTFTPKYAQPGTENVFSMDDVSVFGRQIIGPGLRECIDDGLLPDYRIMAITEVCPGLSNLANKCNQLSNALRQRDYQNRDLYMIPNVLVFVQHVEEIEQVGEHLARMLGTSDPIDVLYAYADKDPSENIKKFRRNAKTIANVGSRRPILISCRVLSEGIDIPEAMAVAIMYPKHSPIDIAQMLLRGGRWALHKNLWFMIFPLASDDDYEGVRDVLATLAERDARIIGDVIKVCQIAGTLSVGGTNTSKDERPASRDLLVFCDTFNSCDIDKINLYFGKLITKHFNLGEGERRISYKTMQKFNRCNGIHSHAQYEQMGATRIVANPREYFRERWISWYDFLDLPGRNAYPRTVELFVQFLIAHGITDDIKTYVDARGRDAAFRDATPEEPAEMYNDFTNFRDVMHAYGAVMQRRATRHNLAQ